MNQNSIIIIELCALLGMAFSFVGICAILIASHRARREFRVKGYVRPPKGRAWIRFLLIRQYEAFDDETIQSAFRVAHFCLLAVMIDAGAILILLGCEFFLNLVASGSGPSVGS
jgi:hypothetical protein